MHGSLAVSWREARGPLNAGRLELRARELTLSGTGPEGRIAQLRVFFEDIAEVRIGREARDRINEGRTVVVDRVGASPVYIASMNGAGTLFELANELVALVGARGGGESRVAVVLPIKPGTRDRAAALVADGPPFDPKAAGLDRHYVFVTDHEVVFVFDGADAQRAVERLIRDPSVWKAAVAWRECLAGRPRLATEEFAWTRSPSAA
jgi:hypothetical protein